MKINTIEEVAEGRAHVSWTTVISEHRGKKLHIFVFRDAMKFDGVPALTWDWKDVPASDPWHTDELFDGVRLPATALELQMIADLCGCMLLTPKVIDLIWLQAKLKFPSITQTQSYPDEDITDDNGVIVANSHIHVLHQRLEAAITKLGGDDGVSLIDSVGKYWCLINNLLTGRTPRGEKLPYGTSNACNYGWPTTMGAYGGVTPGVRVWQTPGFRHDFHHWDPSQTIRLMYREGILVHEDGRREVVRLADVAANPQLAALLHHQPGTLIYLRHNGVSKPGSDVALDIYRPSFDMVA